MSRKKELTKLATLIGMLVLVFVALSVPVWQQNRYLILMKTNHELNKEKTQLENAVQLVNMDINKLRSLSRLDSVATIMGLGYSSAPFKVRSSKTDEVNHEK